MAIGSINLVTNSSQMKQLIAAYKKQNPAKYAGKKEELANKLKALQEAEGVKVEEVE